MKHFWFTYQASRAILVAWICVCVFVWVMDDKFLVNTRRIFCCVSLLAGTKNRSAFGLWLRRNNGCLKCVWTTSIPTAKTIDGRKCGLPAAEYFSSVPVRMNESIGGFKTTTIQSFSSNYTVWLVNVGKQDFLWSPINLKPPWSCSSLYAMKYLESITKIWVVVAMLSGVENRHHCGLLSAK